MKKTLLLVIAAIGFQFSNAQSTLGNVGINTSTPAVTLQVVPKDVTKAIGVMIPQITSTQLRAAEAQYGAAQNGTTVFITSIVDADKVGYTTDIDVIGNYTFYYDATTPASSRWKRMKHSTEANSSTVAYYWWDPQAISTDRSAYSNVKFKNVHNDPTAAYSPTTGFFTAPSKGTYTFNFKNHMGCACYDTFIILLRQYDTTGTALQKDYRVEEVVGGNPSRLCQVGGSQTLFLNKGEKVTWALDVLGSSACTTGGTPAVPVQASWTTFQDNNSAPYTSYMTVSW